MRAIVTYTCSIVNVYIGSSNTRLHYILQIIQINADCHISSLVEIILTTTTIIIMNCITLRKLLIWG